MAPVHKIIKVAASVAAPAPSSSSFSIIDVGMKSSPPANAAPMAMAPIYENISPASSVAAPMPVVPIPTRTLQIPIPVDPMMTMAYVNAYAAYLAACQARVITDSEDKLIYQNGDIIAGNCKFIKNSFLPSFLLIFLSFLLDQIIQTLGQGAFGTVVQAMDYQ